MAVDYRFLPDLLLLSGWILGSHVEHFLLDVGRSPAQVSFFFGLKFDLFEVQVNYFQKVPFLF